MDWFVDRHSRTGDADRPALLDPWRTLTYGQLARDSARFAGALEHAGVQREHRVAMLMLDTVDFAVVFWGCLRAGVIPVPVNTLLPADTICYILADCRAEAVVASTPLLAQLGPSPAPRLVIAAEPNGGPPAMPGANLLALPNFLATGSPDTAPVVCSGDEVAFWLYSSGSTGAPKGVRHVHASLQATAETYGAQVLQIRPDDVVFSVAKLFHAYGLGNAMTFPLSVGACAVLLPDRPTADAVLDVMAQHRPTIFAGVPTLYASLLAHPMIRPGAGSDRLRRCISAGEALPADIGRRWQTMVGQHILDGIGSTEMLHIFISNRADDVTYGTSGKPVPGYEAMVIDEHERPCSYGEMGELIVKGPTAADGYWNQRNKSRRTFRGEWTYTGDRYTKDETGTFRFCGRADEMLKVSGIWVSPFEVEEALIAHPAVLEAAVTGRHDADGLVKPQAFVVLVDPAGGMDHATLIPALQAHVKARIGPWKYPRWIHFVDGLAQDRDGQDPALPAAGGPVIQGVLQLDGRRLETAWWGPPPDAAPSIVLLHEGLGCIDLWRDVPARLAQATGLGVFAWSRFGYGQSDPAPLPRPLTYMQEEAIDLLPRVLAGAGIRQPVMVGHSDGASIAAIHAGCAHDARLRGLVLIAGHYFVEDLSVRSIAALQRDYETGTLRDRLARYHRNVDNAFDGWSGAWLDPGFRAFDVTPALARIAVPVLGLQGEDDAYGTPDQLLALVRHVRAPVETRLIAGARHAPHLEAPDTTLAAITGFIAACLDTRAP